MVFVEGGELHPTLEEIEAGTSGSTSFDAKFWEALFRRLLPSYRFKFKPVGSKATLLDLAARVEANQVQNVVVCMDRDLDDLCGTLIQHARVLYTHGYSWENDVWSTSSTISVFSRLSTAVDSQNAVAEIKAAFSHFDRRLRWPLLAHCLLVTNGILQITTADLERAVVRGAGKMPTITCTHLRQAIKEVRSPRPRLRVNFPRKRRFCTLDDCYGHLLASFAFHTVAHVLKKHSNVRNFGKDVAASIAIEASYAAITKDPRKRHHYRQTFARLRADLASG